MVRSRVVYLADEDSRCEGEVCLVDQRRECDEVLKEVIARHCCAPGVAVEFLGRDRCGRQVGQVFERDFSNGEGRQVHVILV